MDDRRLAELARRQGGVVTTAQVLACGLSRSGLAHRVRADRLFPVRRGAFTLSPYRDATADLWAAVLVTDPVRAVVGSWSAAHLHQLTRRTTSAVHVTVPRTGGRRLPGVVVHAPRRLLPEDVVLVDGLRVTGPGRTVLDIAARATDATVHRLIREGEYLGLLPAGEMLRIVERHPRHPGTGRVRRVDPSTEPGALGQTDLEDELERLIRSLPLTAPERQVEVCGASGASYRLDFGWSTIRLAAEADGRAAHERMSALDGDRFRDNDLAAVGWLTMRFTRSQLLRQRDASARHLVATAAGRGLPSSR